MAGVAVAATSAATRAFRSTSGSAPTTPDEARLPERPDSVPGDGSGHPLALATLLLVAAATALLLAVEAPIPTVVIGLILFGVLHILLELRYVTGRFSGFLSRSFLELLAVLITGIVVCRMLAGVVGRPAQLAEIVLGYAILAVGAQRGLRGRRKFAVWLAIVPAAVASLAWPAYHYLVLTHLVTLLPLVFLWEWSSRIRSVGGRRTFRAAQVLWAVGLPLLVVLGALDGWLSANAGIVRSLVGNGHAVLAASAPPGETAGLVATRLLVAFAFMQTMQYAVWVGFMPRFAPDASATFEARVPWLTGPRLWAVGFIVAAAFAVLFVFDFTQANTLYAAVASYGTYVQLPVALVLLVGAPGRRAAAAPGEKPLPGGSGAAYGRGTEQEGR
jgi:hypothetical protein